MSSGDIDLGVRVSLAELRRQLGAIPGITAAEAKKMAAQFDAASKRMERSAKRSSQTADREYKKTFDDIKRGASAAFGGIVERVNNLTGGLLAVSPALTGIAVGAAAPAAAIAGLGTALIAAQDSAHAALMEMRALGLETVISPEAVARIDATQTSLGVLRAESKLLWIEMESKLTPVTSVFTDALQGLSLAGRVAQKSFGDFIAILSAGAIGAAQTALLNLVAGAAGAAKAMVLLNRAIGLNNPVTNAMSEALDGLVAQIDGWRASTEAAWAPTATMIDVQQEHQIVIKKVGEELRKQADAARAAGAATAAQADATERAVPLLEQLAQAGRDAVDGLSMGASLDLVPPESLDRMSRLQIIIQSLADDWVAVKSVALDSISSILAGLSDIGEMKAQDRADTMRGYQDDLAAIRSNSKLDTVTKKLAVQQKKSQIEQERKLATKAFSAHKAASISEVVMNASVAVLKAFASLGPIAGAIAAAGIGVTAGVQIGKIAKEKPPTYHLGMAPDERPATITRGEAVLAPRAVQRLGGPEMVRDLNAGRVSGGDMPTVTQVVLDSRVIGTIVRRGLAVGSTDAVVKMRRKIANYSGAY